VLSDPLLKLPFVVLDITELVDGKLIWLAGFASDGLNIPPNAPPTNTDFDIDPIFDVSGM
jgi:hypothetical protein